MNDFADDVGARARERELQAQAELVHEARLANEPGSPAKLIKGASQVFAGNPVSDDSKTDGDAGSSKKKLYTNNDTQDEHSTSRLHAKDNSSANILSGESGETGNSAKTKKATVLDEKDGLSGKEIDFERNFTEIFDSLGILPVMIPT